MMGKRNRKQEYVTFRNHDGWVEFKGTLMSPEIRDLLIACERHVLCSCNVKTAPPPLGYDRNGTAVFRGDTAAIIKPNGSLQRDYTIETYCNGKFGLVSADGNTGWFAEPMEVLLLSRAKPEAAKESYADRIQREAHHGAGYSPKPEPCDTAEGLLREMVDRWGNMTIGQLEAYFIRAHKLLEVE